MTNYYDVDIIPIILNIFKVSEIVICGMSDEKIINLIFDYCDDKDISYTMIDSNDNTNNCINDYPINVLPNFKDYDAIFLNDDPNWYTVYNELKIIKDTNVEFPLIFICHNIFPHKRRDSYVNPDIIPIKYRHNFSKELSHGNINIRDGFFHAIESNTPKNGVLTAIEDFLAENSSFNALDINFLNGLTILYFNNSISQIRLGKLYKEIEDYVIEYDYISDNIVENQLLSDYISKFDFANNNLDVIENIKDELDEKNGIIEEYEEKIKLHNDEIRYKNSKINSVDSQLSLKDAQIKNFESKLINRENEISNLNNELQKANLEITSLKSDISKKEEVENNLNIQLQISDNKIKKNIQQLNQKNSTIQFMDNQIRSKESELNDKNLLLNNIKQQYTAQLSKLDAKEYCINCFKEEISNNHLEIEYLKNNTLIKKMLNPFSYIYLIFKSNPKELSLNIKLYKALKNSKCFDIGYYLNNNEDLKKSKWCKYFSPELHYVCNGFNENRNFNKKYYNRNSKEALLEYIKNCP